MLGFLKDLTVFEVSPVLVGANQDTYTMAIKSNKELLKEIVGEERKVSCHSTFLENEEPEEKPKEEEKSITVENY